MSLTTVADTATYGGSGVAVIFGLTADEWQAVGVVGGLIIALLGLIARVAIDVYYKNRELKLMEKHGAAPNSRPDFGADEAD